MSMGRVGSPRCALCLWRGELQRASQLREGRWHGLTSLCHVMRESMHCGQLVEFGISAFKKLSRERHNDDRVGTQCPVQDAGRSASNATHGGVATSSSQDYVRRTVPNLVCRMGKHQHRGELVCRRVVAAAIAATTTIDMDARRYRDRDPDGEYR